MKLLTIRILCLLVSISSSVAWAQSVDLGTDLNLFGVRPSMQQLVEPIFTTGTVLALRSTDLVPLVGGMVEEIMVRVGDRVEKGQPLLRMRQKDFEIRLERLTQSARLAAAERNNAKQDYENAVALIKRGALSKEQLDDRRTRYEAASAQLGIAQADLAEARQALEDSVLRAPYTGVITQRNIDEGAYVASFMRTSQPVLQVQEISTMVAVVFVPERYLNAIEVGTKGRVKVVATEKTYDSQIHVINDRIDVESRSIDVRLGILNPEYEIKPGQFIEVELYPSPRTTLTIPAEVVRGIGAQRYVYVDVDGRATRVDIEANELENGLIEVLSGLNQTDLVIGGSDLSLLSEGQSLSRGDES